MSETIFIDANVIIAFANEDDMHYKNSVDLLTKVLAERNMITTDYVFDEILSVTRRKRSHKEALALGKHLFASEILIAPIHSEIFDQSWILFQNYDLSFTDCTNIAFMKQHGITKIATFDKGFKSIPGITILN